MIILTQPSAFLNVTNSLKNILVPDVTQAPNNVVVAQPLLISTDRSLKWIYSIQDLISDLISTGEIIATFKTNGNISYSIYGKTGDVINYTIAPIIVSSVIKIQITNLSNNNLYENLIR